MFLTADSDVLILKLTQINNARKTEAAFWAGRVADMLGDSAGAKTYWKIAATYPMSFYGALATAMLGKTPEYEFFDQECSDEDIEELKQTKYGKMALSLIQVGRKNRAEQYLKYLVTAKASDKLYMLLMRYRHYMDYPVFQFWFLVLCATGVFWK